MGTINDKITFVSSHDEKSLRQLRKVVRYKLSRLAKKDIYCNGIQKLITPVMSYHCNGESCFILIPDGSKIGWEVHEAIKDIRSSLHEQVEIVNRNLGRNVISIITFNLREDGHLDTLMSSNDFKYYS